MGGGASKSNDKAATTGAPNNNNTNAQAAAAAPPAPPPPLPPAGIHFNVTHLTCVGTRTTGRGKMKQTETIHRRMSVIGVELPGLELADGTPTGHRDPQKLSKIVKIQRIPNKLSGVKVTVQGTVRNIPHAAFQDPEKNEWALDPLGELQWAVPITAAVTSNHTRAITTKAETREITESWDIEEILWDDSFVPVLSYVDGVLTIGLVENGIEDTQVAGKTNTPANPYENPPSPPPVFNVTHVSCVGTRKGGRGKTKVTQIVMKRMALVAIELPGLALLAAGSSVKDPSKINEIINVDRIEGKLSGVRIRITTTSRSIPLEAFDDPERNEWALDPLGALQWGAPLNGVVTLPGTRPIGVGKEDRPIDLAWDIDEIVWDNAHEPALSYIDGILVVGLVESGVSDDGGIKSPTAAAPAPTTTTDSSSTPVTSTSTGSANKYEVNNQEGTPNKSSEKANMEGSRTTDGPTPTKAT